MIARKHLLFGLSCLAVGMTLGIFMALSGDHSQAATHVHLNLVGGVVSILYAAILRLWVPDAESSLLVVAQGYVHQVGALIMVLGLAALFSNIFPPVLVAPFVVIGAVSVLVAMIMMIIIAVKNK